MALKVRGMTLIELVIYIAMAAVVAIVAGSLFVLARNTTESTNSNYFLSADTETAVAWLRRDLQQCSLASIQSFPGEGKGTPGASFCSALQSEDVKRIDANDSGHPNWHNHVYYTLVGTDKTTGKLVRWSQPTSADAFQFPTLAPLQPTAVVSATSRAIHTRVLMPNQELYGVGNPDGKIDGHGGFHLQFVRQSENDGSETLSDTNPSAPELLKKGDFRSNTRLVQLELKFFTSSSTGKPSFYSLRFRVCPRY